MESIAAMKMGLAKSFQFKGRAKRSDFWLFAPLGLTFGVLGCFVGVGLLDQSRPLTLLWLPLFTLLGFVPLMAAGSRRLQDTGENGQDIFLPMVPFLIFSMFFAFSAHGSFGILLAILTVPTLGIILGLIYWVLLAAIFLLAPIAGLFFVGSTIGQLIVSSDPQSNKYGPNPHEVPS